MRRRRRSTFYYQAKVQQGGGTDTEIKSDQRFVQLLGLKSLVRPKKYPSYRGQSSLHVPNIRTKLKGLSPVLFRTQPSAG